MFALAYRVQLALGLMLKYSPLLTSLFTGKLGGKLVFALAYRVQLTLGLILKYLPLSKSLFTGKFGEKIVGVCITFRVNLTLFAALCQFNNPFVV